MEGILHSQPIARGHKGTQRALTAAAYICLGLGLSIGTVISTLGCESKMDAQPSRFTGVGVEVTMEAAGARVTRVLSHGGAELAGVKIGDVFLEIDGLATRGQTLAQVVDRLRGDPDTNVKVLSRTKGGNDMLSMLRKPMTNHKP